MKTITFTQAQFDAIPEHPSPPRAQKGLRWKRLYRDQWFVAEYVEVARDVLGIEFWEVVIEEVTRL